MTEATAAQHVPSSSGSRRRFPDSGVLEAESPNRGWRKRGGTRAVLLVSCVLALSCATRVVSLDHRPREYVASDYSEVLKRWTREERLISANEFADFLSATATFESWDFRWAYAIKYADDFRLTVTQRRELMDRLLTETGRYHHFYVALHSPRYKWADLTAEHPAWIVRLVDSQGNETAPHDIERIKKPTAADQTYFPYSTPWRVVHRIRFPVETPSGEPTISTEARWLGLRFAGPKGHSQLEWEIGSRGASGSVDGF